MKIGLIQIDGKTPNLALLKLAQWHKEKGDDPIIIDLSSYGIKHWYGSKIFMGGSGYDFNGKLPEDIEEICPDYEKFSLDHSIGFTSRGGIRNCSFCIVKEKEGKFHEVPQDWMKGNKILLLDNNFLASKIWKDKLQDFIDNKTKVCFNQGLDIRLIDKEKVEILAKVDYRDDSFKTKRIYFAWDDIKLEPIVFKEINLLMESGIKPNHLMFYILVNFNSTFEEDMYRVIKLKNIGVKPYIMIYNKDKASKEIKSLQRWVNRGAVKY